MSKTAIIIGATGVVGSELLTLLLTSSEFSRVIAITRRKLDFEHAKLTNQVIDFNCLTNYCTLFKGDVLFSCLGTTKKQAGSITAQRKVDFNYQFIAAQMAVNNGVSHYCLVSSSGANAHSVSSYLKMKGELEQHVTSLGFAKVSIFQPSLLIGERRDTRIAEQIGACALPILTRLPFLKRYKPITGKQVALKMRAVSLTQQQPLQYYVLDALFKI
ncbi:NAD-dependent epimerase/dehydratase family protein [uncultured Pseudoalteromonas sp.]|uniref:NAD-dependent epimerase/dehydratase family protein n=1 Tax=uncultured Pseudoalteromonas sp. TaxID=114053 RepID=UPI0030C7A77A